jgi:hypothetical protein
VTAVFHNSMSLQLTAEQMKVLGMEAYATPKSRQVLMERIGKAVFDGAMVRLIQGLNEEQILALNHALESCDSFMCVIEYVERVYPQFQKYLREEQEGFVEAYLAQLQPKA